MKIVTRDELMQEPAGTVYCSTDYGELSVLLEVIDDDSGNHVDWFMSTAQPAIHNGEELCLGAVMREGTFDYGAKYIVLDDVDRKWLANLILTGNADGWDDLTRSV